MADEDTATKELLIQVNVVHVSNGWVAASTLGGITVRSPYVPTANEAVLQLLTRILNNHDDSQLGLALALDGTSMSEVTSAPALPTKSKR